MSKECSFIGRRIRSIRYMRNRRIQSIVLGNRWVGMVILIIKIVISSRREKSHHLK